MCNLWSTADYTIIASLFPRLVGAIYFFAFGAFLFQIRGLLGKNGIQPAEEYLAWLKTRLPKRCFWVAPSIFWIKATDSWLLAVVGIGTIASILLMLGFWPTFLLIVLFLLYLSIISVGQDFLSFGWELFLQEVALYAILLSLTPVPNFMVWLAINFLLFRFHIQSGAVKLQSHDPHWNNLTAIAYHYQSQPIPNLIAWYAHKLPIWFHKLSCIFMFVVELVVPIFLFFTEESRLVVFCLFVALQFCIWATGNFSYLNHLTVVFCTILLNNSALQAIGFKPTIVKESFFLMDYFCTLAGCALLFLQIIRLWDHFYPNYRFQKILKPCSFFHIVNRYGIFAVMTTTRYEVVVEASSDGITWKEYTFFHKPSELSRRPKRISPYQPRVDWQAWFLPFQGFETEEWFQHFLAHLLKGTPEVLALIRHNPFPDAPPKHIRAMMYIYEFTSCKEKKESGNWWKRKLVGRYSQDMVLHAVD